MASKDPPGAKVTPVMQQYHDIKSAHEDAILFFRMGDFYEMFFEDAEKAAALLDITLTSRNRNDPNPIPMCGIPYHSVRPYVARLLEAGCRVAMCEQVALPSGNSKLAKRQVTRVITPGTNLDEESLAPERSNLLAFVVADASGIGVAVTDFSTGEARVTQLDVDGPIEDELVALAPREVLLDDSVNPQLEARLRATLPGCAIDRKSFDAVDAAALDGVPEVAARAYASLLAYVRATQGDATTHLRAPQVYHASEFLQLDAATRRNLEVVESLQGGKSGTLVSVLDRSVTAMGKRMVRRWLVAPLVDPIDIAARLDAVELLIERAGERGELREILAGIGDLERLAGRIGAGTASPRDVVRLADALEGVEGLARALTGVLAGVTVTGDLPALAGRLDGLESVRGKIRAALLEDAPPTTSKGAIIRDGFDPEVDRLRSVSRDGKGWIAAFEASERQRTGIPKLKVGFNRVFGYFIEVSRANTALVPKEYTRKQTLANAERYITDDLKAREAEVLGADERLSALETHLFGQLVDGLSQHQTVLGRNAEALGAIDGLLGFAEAAHTGGYVRPEMHEGAELEIREGRHPVIEQVLSDRFVSNDCVLGSSDCTVMVITGPNMAGKSTYLRQVALLALMAHCGSFVPASYARIPLVDRIFTRIGASDNLSAGQSTFMVEMSETANILSHMTSRSLVVLDEIGRGTSTFDGISIAWAVAEAMVSARVKTVFATHYHELAGLEAEHASVANYSVAVRRYKGDIVFLYRVVAGPTSGSYGIEVAKLAGVPPSVISQAREILARFERGEGVGATTAAQLSLFSAARPEQAPAGGSDLEARIAAIDAETLSPLEALNLLADLVAEARKAQ